MKTQMELSEAAKWQLLQEMRRGIYCHDKRLPPEVEIAERMGVSRNVIRDSLAALEREGFVSRRRGVGTIVNRYVLDLSTRMDLADGFDAMIQGSGCRPGSRFVNMKQIPCSAQIAQKLGLREQDMVFEICRLVTADEKPAIYCRDYVDVHFFGEDTSRFNYDGLVISSFEFLQKVAFMDLAELEAISADEELAAICEVAPGAPLLFVEAVHYTFKGKPALYSQEYYVPGTVKHRKLRKKI